MLHHDEIEQILEGVAQHVDAASNHARRADGAVDDLAGAAASAYLTMLAGRATGQPSVPLLARRIGKARASCANLVRALRAAVRRCRRAEQLLEGTALVAAPTAFFVALGTASGDENFQGRPPERHAVGTGRRQNDGPPSSRASVTRLETRARTASGAPGGEEQNA